MSELTELARACAISSKATSELTHFFQNWKKSHSEIVLRFFPSRAVQQKSTLKIIEGINFKCVRLPFYVQQEEGPEIIL